MVRIRSHQQQIDELRGRQLALLRLMQPEEALIVLAAAPVSHDEEHDLIADILQRRILGESIERHATER